MSKSKLYKITEEQVQTIREALSNCNGDWWIAVRWGEDWNRNNEAFGTLLGCDGTHIQEGIKGLEIALCLSHNMTQFGAIHKVLEGSDIHGLRIEGRMRFPIKTTSLDFLKGLSSLHSLTCTYSPYISDISPLKELINLKELSLTLFEDLHDISSLQELKKLHTLNLSMDHTKDISPLQNLTQLEHLSLSLTKLTDASALQKLKNIHTLNFNGCSALQDISAIGALINLKTLNFNGCSSLVDMSPLKNLINLKKLNICGTRRNKSPLIDVSSLEHLTNLQHLTLRRCFVLTDISPLSSLTNLTILDMRACTAIEDLHALGDMTSLVELTMGGDIRDANNAITDISSLVSLNNLRKLDLSLCTSLSDISSLGHLPNLASLNLSNCDAIQDISSLQMLNNLDTLTIGCDSLEELTPIRGLTNLSSLTFVWCSKIADITPLGSCTNLRSVVLRNCISLQDLSPFTELQSLEVLSISSCESIVDLSPLKDIKTLHSISIRSKSFSDISSLASIQSLQSLNLNMCSSITDITPLHSLISLQKLNLGRCRNIKDISSLENLRKLEELNLADCTELSDNQTWLPLTKLPSIKMLTGPFPSHFTVKIFARNAANNQDWTYIRKHLDNWVQTAKSSATEPNLLTQIGRSAAINPAGYEALATIISLSTTNDAPDIDELFATATPIFLHNIIGSALHDAVAQADQPLPPKTLLALHKYMPTKINLRDNTMIALTRSISKAIVPEWGTKTAQALREQLNDSRYPVTVSVHNDGFSVLANQQFTPIQSHFFGVLCSGHGRSTDIEWRDHFHMLLCGLALSQSDTSIRNQSLSDISSGLAICSDEVWVQQRLDYLLEAAAEIDPDTSVIYAAVAYAHAIGGRWNEAQETVSGIASPTIRDGSLNKLCAMVLETIIHDKMPRAIIFTNALSEPLERAQKLYLLGFHEGLLDNLVAYGDLVRLLTEFPQKQKEVVAHVTEKRPDILESKQEGNGTPLSYEECSAMVKRVFPNRYHEILNVLTQHGNT